MADQAGMGDLMASLSLGLVATATGDIGEAAAAPSGGKRARVGRGADPGWLPCNPPLVIGLERAMIELAQLGRVLMHSLDWKHGPAHTSTSSVTYIFKCHFANKQNCPFRIRLLIPRGGVSSNPTDFVHVQDVHHGCIHIHHEIHMQYSANFPHENHEATPRVNQGAHPLWMAACVENPLCLTYNWHQIMTWLGHCHLLPGPDDVMRVVHACKKWCEAEMWRKGILFSMSCLRAHTCASCCMCN
jgi:hypothetical protein